MTAALLPRPSVGAAARPAHRADLEGLRGLAVLSVFAVHAVPDALAGGFIGVDVFFVLSGFLIATISLPQIEAGRFGALDFYQRRLKRLLPSLLLVLGLCAVFAALVALPQDVAAIGRQIAAGATFTANLLFWSEASYFDPSSDHKLLLHLWSLGVEAQFYAAWPLLAVLLARSRGPRERLLWVTAVLLVSFALNIAFVHDKPKAVFFLPPTRVWELLMGAWLAFALRCWPSAGPHGVRPEPLANAFATTGVALMVCALLALDKTAAFPGWWALLPTTATVLLIAGGGRGWLARRVLSQPLLCFYGRISYPLYLWHWPLLVMPRLMGMELDRIELMTLLVVAVLAATETARWVEPRAGAMPADGWRAHAKLAALPAALACGLWLSTSPGWPNRYPAELSAVARLHLDTDRQGYRSGLCFLQNPEQRAEHFHRLCDATSDGSMPAVLLWGDSHAAALYPGLAAALAHGPGLAHPRAVLGQYTAAACPPLPPGSPRLPDRCAAINTGVLDRVALHRPDRVVLAASWSSYRPSRAEPGPDAQDIARLVDEVAAMIDRLKQRGVREVVVVGPLPVWRVEPPRRLLGGWVRGQETPVWVPDGLNPRVMALERQMTASIPLRGARYVSALEAACDAPGCRVSLPDPPGQFQAVAFDLSHLTQAGSQAVVAPIAASLLGPLAELAR